MPSNDALTALDNNGVATHTLHSLLSKDWPQYKQCEKTIVFDGGTANGIGDDGGTQDPYIAFTVTGMVEVMVIGVGVVAPTSAGGGSLAVGTVVNPTGLITTTTATAIAANEIWHDATPDATLELTSVATKKIITTNIILTTATADITAGTIKLIVRWAPISADGNVVAV